MAETTPGQNYTPMVGDTLTWLGEPRPVYTRLQRIVTAPDDNGHMDVDTTSYLGDTTRVVCTVGEWRADAAHNMWRLDAPRVVETPAGVGTLAAAYADARRAVCALTDALESYVPGCEVGDLDWTPDTDGGTFAWNDGNATVSELGLTHGRWPMHSSTAPLDAPHMADAVAYRAWVSAGKAAAQEALAGRTRERDEENLRNRMRALYGEDATRRALAALGGGL